MPAQSALAIHSRVSSISVSPKSKTTASKRRRVGWIPLTFV
jgi:hypothetical protein